MPAIPTYKLPDDLIEHIKTYMDESTEKMKEFSADSKEVKQLLENQMTMKTTFAYDMDTPIPGQPVKADKLENVSNDNIKEVAEDTLISYAAQAKLKRERAAEAKKPMHERVKEFYIETAVRNQKNDYFNKHGYEMSGKQLRQLKRIVTNKYNTGKLRPNEKEYEEIVNYLNSPLNDPNNKKVNPAVNNKMSGSQQIGSLMSMI